MPFEENALKHSVALEGRRKLSVSGVEEVDSFDENTIVMVTASGLLVIRGEALHIEALSLEGGELKVTGDIDSLSYEDNDRQVGLFSRLFRS